MESLCKEPTITQLINTLKRADQLKRLQYLEPLCTLKMTTTPPA